MVSRHQVAITEFIILAALDYKVRSLDVSDLALQTEDYQSESGRWLWVDVRSLY